MSTETTLSVLKIIHGTTVDGRGLRSAIYFAGCNHCCDGCHNPDSWDIKKGTPAAISDILAEIEENDFNVTFTGGDPLVQIEGLIILAKAIKERFNKNIWCYTGYTIEEIKANQSLSEILKYIDVLVDSPFILSQRNADLPFRGSSNQRIINHTEF